MIKRREFARERKRNGSMQFFHGSNVEDEAIASGQRGLERKRDLGQASLTAHPLRSSFVIGRRVQLVPRKRERLIRAVLR